jgi:uncharacterized membrane protein YbaN (DUF454 family)
VHPVPDTQEAADQPAVAEASTPPLTREWVDYSAELRLFKHPALRLLFIVGGLIAIGLGVVGYIVPGIPGTVFFLIATWFFAQSSPRFYNWVLNHRLFGPLIRDYRAGRGIPRWVKWYASSMILVVSAFSTWVVGVQRGNTIVGVLIAATALFGVWYVFHVPTKPAAQPQEGGRP